MTRCQCEQNPPARAAARQVVRARLAACLLALLGACSAPDYSPVRDWARTATLAVDYPPASAATREGAVLGPDEGVLALQAAFVTYLSALGRVADDGVLPYRDDPMRDVAARAARTNERGGQAVAALGALLRQATRGNWQAPHVRRLITAADPQVQVLVEALSHYLILADELDRQAGLDASAEDAALERGARTAEARRAIQDAGAVRERQRAARGIARLQYDAIVRQVGQGHAMLRARAATITDAETVALIRASEDRLRRAAQALPRPPVLATPPAPFPDHVHGWPRSGVPAA